MTNVNVPESNSQQDESRPSSNDMQTEQYISNEMMVLQNLAIL